MAGKRPDMCGWRRAELFLNNLVDQLAAMLEAPVSAATTARFLESSR